MRNMVFGGVIICSLITGRNACFGQTLAVTPATASATQGQSITFTSNQAVTWSLANGSSGTLIQNSSTSATYTAPNLVLPQGVSAGCQTTPNDSVFNARIDNLPVEARSTTWIAAMSTTPLTIQPDFGVNVIDVSTPMLQENFLYTPQNNGYFGRTLQPILKRQGGAYQTDLSTGSSDRHALYVDPRSCTFYEAYKQYFTPRACRTNQTCTGTSGVAYSWSSYVLPPGSTQASNLIYFPLMIRAAEIHQGVIPHALSFTDSTASIHAMSYWPANSTLGCATCVNSPPYGARFRLQSTFGISTFSRNAQVILRALQQYGMFLSDASVGGAVLYADTDTTQDPALTAAFAEIANAHIAMTAFDAVDESSFIVNPKLSQVNPANPYQAPSNYAVVTATPASGSGVSIPVALGAQAPGTPSSTLYVLAGTPSYTLKSWVGGSANPALSWQLVSGVGSVTTAGVYTPPASVTAPSQAVLQLVPGSSPGVVAQVNVTVLPASSDHSIRIDVGSSTPTTSAGGTKRWLADTAFEGAIDVVHGDYPKWLNQADPDINIYQTFHYVHGSDLTYSLIVPNGNYKARLMFGAPYNGHTSCTQPCTYDPLVSYTTWGPYNLIANGQVAAHNFDFGIPTNHTVAATSDIYVPLAVTNNELTLSVRGNRPDSVSGLPQIMPVLEGIEILPDSTMPHLAIDTQQQTSVPAGMSLQLYAVGWYMDNSVQWNMVSGEGSIDQNGVYTAPAIAPSSPETVIIQATSNVWGHVSATVNLTIPASS